MLIEMMLTAAVAQVMHVKEGCAVVRADAPVNVGDVLILKRLEPTPGPPG